MLPAPDRVHTVYLVHHGFRESIEIFEIDTPTPDPHVHLDRLRGCAGDSRPELGQPSSRRADSRQPIPIAAASRRRARTNTGEIWEWNPKDGWTIVPGSESQGPNGIEASPDGRWLYVNLWPARKVMRLSRGQTPVVKDFVDVAFQPDNIRWQADGSLLAAGHGGPNMPRVIECLIKVCADAASVVARIDPKTWTAKEIIRYPASEKFFSSTVALQVGKEIWIGTITGDRIARYPIQ